ncbi:hypothetical protein [Streptomyces griseoflavus]|uniref:hypothetical protein n=1 Tax=Streptomyces griseoflavus TaxID=35619 RepID=UPI0033B617D3
MTTQMFVGPGPVAGPAQRRRLTPLAAIDPRDAARTAARIGETGDRRPAKPVTFDSAL